MPTGYTSDLYDGKDITFPQFAMTCARAFGALITMRDADLAATIPDEFKADDYHLNRANEAERSLALLRAMKPDEVAEAAANANAEALNRWEKSQAETLALRQRYEAMLAEVEAWTPPAEDHQGLKDFMAEQITSSIRFDCSTSPRPAEVDAATWFEQQVDRHKSDVEYHRNHYAEDVERASQRTGWVRALRASLVEHAGA